MKINFVNFSSIITVNHENVIGGPPRTNTAILAFRLLIGLFNACLVEKTQTYTSNFSENTSRERHFSPFMWKLSKIYIDRAFTRTLVTYLNFGGSPWRIYFKPTSCHQCDFLEESTAPLGHVQGHKSYDVEGGHIQLLNKAILQQLIQFSSLDVLYDRRHLLNATMCKVCIIPYRLIPSNQAYWLICILNQACNMLHCCPT